MRRKKTVSIYVDPSKDYLIYLIYRDHKTKCTIEKDMYTWKKGGYLKNE